MQEIKFRAWDKRKKEMCKVLGINWAEQQILCMPIRPGKNAVACRWRDIEEFIIMQFINKQDKNGNDIYEGDKLKSGRSIAIVETDNDISQDFHWGNASGFRFNFDPNKMTPCDWSYKLIGNIYQNPELLETENAENGEGRS